MSEMTKVEASELAALDAYWPTCSDEMPYETYRRWCDLQVKRRDAIAAGSETAETSATSAQCEASQSGAESASPEPHPVSRKDEK